MTHDDTTRTADATATVQNTHRLITVERHGEQVILNGPRGGRVELKAPDEATQIATAIQAVIPAAWKE